jgi:hypothetical protein
MVYGAPEGSERAEHSLRALKHSLSPHPGRLKYESIPKAAVVPPLPWAMRFAPIRGRENEFESAIPHGQTLRRIEFGTPTPLFIIPASAFFV